MSIGLNYDFWD